VLTPRSPDLAFAGRTERLVAFAKTRRFVETSIITKSSDRTKTGHQSHFINKNNACIRLLRQTHHFEALDRAD
jgi:hypothetical protein